MPFYQGVTAVAEPDVDRDEQLEQAQAELTEAKDAVGAAQLDGADLKGPEKRLAEAQAKVRAREAASEVQLQRDKKAAAEQQAREDARAKWAKLAWHEEQAKRLVAWHKSDAQNQARKQAVFGMGTAPAERSGSWFDDERDAGRFPEIGLPVQTETGFNTMRPREVLVDCGGLSLQETEAEAKRLAPLVAKAAKELEELGGEAKPEALPWNTKDRSTTSTA